MAQPRAAAVSAAPITGASSIRRSSNRAGSSTCVTRQATHLNRRGRTVLPSRPGPNTVRRRRGAIMVEMHGYGRAHPPERRQIVGSVLHLADREPCRRLNDAVCVCVGEVRAPADPAQAGPDLVIDVADLIWEPIAG
jgi:hypothetical protein